LLLTWSRLCPRALALPICLAIAGIAAVGTAASASPVAYAAKTCKPPKYPGSGYFTSLKVSGTSCSTGSKVTVGYYRCRLRHGVRGRCTSRVSGYKCTEKRNSIPTEIDARVTCKRGSATVVHTYQQDT
jgi:hypothetical protein